MGNLKIKVNDKEEYSFDTSKLDTREKIIKIMGSLILLSALDDLSSAKPIK